MGEVLIKMDKDVYKIQLIDEDSENYTFKLPLKLSKIAIDKNYKYIFISIVDGGDKNEK